MSDDSDFSQEVEVGWINWFCTLEDHHFFIEVDQNYIRDTANLYGLKHLFPRYDEALLMILRHRPPAQNQIDDPKFLQLYQIATQLYGLIHARYICTPIGLALMRERYLTGKFGNCPRVMCQGQNAIPIGISTDTKLSRVKIYCPRCKDIFNPKKKFADVDGAYFGPSFPHLLLMTYPDLLPPFKKQFYVPSLYGFKIQQQNPQHGHSQLLTEKKPHQSRIQYHNKEQESIQNIKPQPSVNKKKNKKKR